MGFKGRSAIITGAAQGIGRAIAKDLAEQGVNILACDVNGSKIKDVASEIVTSGGSAVGLTADVTNPSQVRDMIGVATDLFSDIDILVNNVGGSGTIDTDHIEEVTDDLWNTIIDVNMKSMFLSCRAVVPYMKSQHYGKIVNISSVAAKGSFGPRGTSAARLPYAGAKAGVVGFTIQLAKDLGPFGIYVNAVMPGLILTEPGSRVYERYAALSENTRAEGPAQVPLGRRGTPQEVAKAVSFLASDDASYVTGTILEVGGGI